MRKAYLSLVKPINSHWFKMSCCTCLVFSCVYCFFHKTMKWYKNICSAWISRTAGEIFSCQIDVINVSKNQKIYCYFMENPPMDFCKVILLRHFLCRCKLVFCRLKLRTAEEKNPNCNGFFIAYTPCWFKYVIIIILLRVYIIIILLRVYIIIILLRVKRSMG